MQFSPLLVKFMFDKWFLLNLQYKSNLQASLSQLTPRTTRKSNQNSEQRIFLKSVHFEIVVLLWYRGFIVISWFQMTTIHSPQLDNKSRMIEWVYIAGNVSLISPRPRSPCLDLKQPELNLKYLKKLQTPEVVDYRGCWIYGCHDIFKTSIPGA